MGALLKLDDFLDNPQVRMQPGTVPRTSRNTDLEIQEPNEDCSQNDQQPEVGSSVYPPPPESVELDPDEAPYTWRNKKSKERKSALPICRIKPSKLTDTENWK